MPSIDTKKLLKSLSELHPKLIDLSLNRVEKLLSLLGNPQGKIPPVIHVAGTNGKGSTVAFIKAGIEADQKKAHIFSSPHLRTFNERICLRGENIENELLKKYLGICKEYNKKNNITLFEITTCAAFLAFSEVTADYTLLEVGLGGRLDATNVIKNPILSIITPISLDHQKHLGNNIEKIAQEKAGILKTEIPAIIGKQEKKALEKIIEVSHSVGTSLHIFGRDWFVYHKDNCLIFEDKDGSIYLPNPSLKGAHQFENAGIAIAAQKKINLSENAIKKSMQNVCWPARLQKLESGPLIDFVSKFPYPIEIWLDGGHNEAAAEVLADFSKNRVGHETHLVCGMLNSKSPTRFFSKLATVVKSVTGIDIPGEENSLPKETIHYSARKFFENCYTAESEVAAVKNICFNKKTKTCLQIIICGSLYLSGHILQKHS